MGKKETLLKNLKTLRERHKFSQQTIAGYLGLDQTTISKIEKGDRQITVDMLDKLACLYGIQPSDFMSDEISAGFKYAFRAKEVTVDDLNSISTINRIALNSRFMERIIGDKT